MVALAERFGAWSGPLDLRAVHRALEIGLAALIGLQLARLIWILVAFPGAFGAPPSARPAPTARVDITVLERFDPFFRGAEGLIGSAGGLEGYTLFGVRIGPAGSSAILSGPDGVQGSFAVGETVGPGVTLSEVGSDYVVLQAGGADVRLDFPAYSTTAAAPAAGGPVAPPAEAAPLTDPTRAAGAARLQPRVRGGRVLGAVLVQPNAALTRAGLQAGDVVLAVDGEALEDAESIEDFGSRVAQPVDA
jgi:general secretion pathway protein C